MLTRLPPPHPARLPQNVAPTVLLLEGGYNLTSVAKATEACVRVLLGDRPPPLPAHQPASDAGMSAVAVAMRVQARYWRCCRQLLARLAPPAAPALALHAGGQQAQHGGGREEADEDTDTPHVDHTRGGAQFGPASGWESDGGSLGNSKSPLAGGAASGAAALQRAGSDTALGSEGAEEGEDGQGEDLGGAASSGPEEEEEEEVQLLQGSHASGSGGLPSPTLRAAAALDASSADLLPREHSGTVPTPQLPSSLALSSSPSGLECAAEEGRGSEQQQASTEAGAAAGGGGLDEDEVEDAAPHGSAAAANWRSLALKVVAMKRSGSGHRAPRLSPQVRGAPGGLAAASGRSGSAGTQEPPAAVGYFERWAVVPRPWAAVCMLRARACGLAQAAARVLTCPPAPSTVCSCCARHWPASCGRRLDERS